MEEDLIALEILCWKKAKRRHPGMSLTEFRFLVNSAIQEIGRTREIPKERPNGREAEEIAEDILRTLDKKVENWRPQVDN